MNDFSRIQNVKNLEIKLHDLDGFRNAAEDAKVGKNAKEMIASAQRPKAPTQTLDISPLVERAQDILRGLAPLLKSREAFVSEKRNAETEAQEFEAKSKMAAQKATRLGKSIERVDKDIAEIMSTVF